MVNVIFRQPLKVKAEPTRETWDGLHPTVASRRPQTATKGDNLAPLVKEIEGEFRRIQAAPAPKVGPAGGGMAKPSKGAKDALGRELEDSLMTD
jgi:hypothetical protein